MFILQKDKEFSSTDYYILKEILEFSNISFIIGESQSDVITTSQSLVIV